MSQLMIEAWEKEDLLERAEKSLKLLYYHDLVSASEYQKSKRRIALRRRSRDKGKGVSQIGLVNDLLRRN